MNLSGGGEDNELIIDSEAQSSVTGVVHRNRQMLEDFLGCVEVKQLPEHLRHRMSREVTMTYRERGLDQKDLDDLFVLYRVFMEGWDLSVEERDMTLASKCEGVNLWGGVEIMLKQGTYPAENSAERILWSREFMGALKAGILSISQAKINIKQRLQALLKERKIREKQVKSFLKLHKKAKRFKNVPSRVYSISLFGKADYKTRGNMIIRLSGLLEEKGVIEGKDYHGFLGEINNMLAQAKSSSAVKAWDIYDEIAGRLKGKNLPRCIELLSEARTLRDNVVREIKGQLNLVRSELRKADSENLSNEERQKFSGYLDAFSGLASRLKMSQSLGVRIVETELQLISFLDNSSASVEDDYSQPDRIDYLLEVQNENEFVARTLHQVAALIMSSSPLLETEHAAQKELISHSEMAVTEEGFLKKQHGYVEDTFLENDFSEDDDLEERHKIAYWEQTRITAFKPSPVRANRDYLRDILVSGKHLQITNEYLVMNMERAKQVMRSRIIENLDQLPGTTANSKMGYYKTLISLIEGSEKMSRGFVEKILSGLRG